LPRKLLYQTRHCLKKIGDSFNIKDAAGMQRIHELEVSARQSGIAKTELPAKEAGSTTGAFDDRIKNY